MPKRKAPKTWAEEIADLDDPAPPDLDSESLHNDASSNSNDGSSDEDTTTAQAREHYLDVGKSKIRKLDALVLGEGYGGESVRRGDVFGGGRISDDDDPFASAREEQEGGSEESDSEEVIDDNGDMGMGSDLDDESEKHGEGSGEDPGVGDGDESRRSGGRRRKAIKSERMRGLEEQDDDQETTSAGLSDMDSDRPEKPTHPSTHTKQNSTSLTHPLISHPTPSDPENTDTDSSSQQSSHSSSRSSSISTPPPPSHTTSRETLRKLFSSQPSTTTTSALKSDVAKGLAIIQQRKTFNTLLNTRIRLQKALIAANSLPSSPPPPTNPLKDLEAAEKAAMDLFTRLETLRCSLYRSPSP
ncbi:MAG: hypothetical protein Q9222_005527, partial [Ikaeria aurantiellina]